MNDLKTKIDDLDVAKLKTVPLDFKKLNDIVSKEVVKNTIFNTLNLKVNSLEKFFDTSNLNKSIQHIQAKSGEKNWRCWE